MDHRDEAAAQLERQKKESVSHALVKAGRLVDTLGITRIRSLTNAPEIRPAHLHLFPHIDLDGTRATTIAQRAGLSKQAVGVLIAELETMDILERIADPKDGRARLVRFTHRPGRSLSDGLNLLGELDEEIKALLGTAGYARLRNELNRVLVHFEQRVGALPTTGSQR